MVQQSSSLTSQNCGYCGGKGETSNGLCRPCGGHGTVMVPEPARQCVICRGTGVAGTARCGRCQGTGWAMARKIS